MEKPLFILALSLLAVGFTDCSKTKVLPRPVEDFWSQCMSITDLRTSSAAEATVGHSAYNGLVNFKTPNSKNQVNILTRTIWNKVKIPVCWEDADPEGLVAAERETVRNAVERTWNSIYDNTSVEESQRLEFVGWDECGSGNNDGIRIRVLDVGPYVVALGQDLMNIRNGMVLNFTFKNWSTSCQWDRHRCIDYIAVHEFGHALGMSHEQNRRDTPSWCNTPQGSNGDVYIGAWDQESVMNYCSSEWNNSGRLTATDILGIRSVYAPFISQEFCHLFGDLVNQDFQEFTDPNLERPFDFMIDLGDDLRL